MASKLAALLIFTLFALALGAGCASSTGGGGQPGGQSTSGTQGEIYPGPTVTAPPNYAVEVQENRNPNTVHPDITVTFRGGKGQIFLKKILATVVTSDGKVVSKEIDQPPNGQISVGDSVTFQGTTGVDRVIVVVTILGKDYKIMDKMDDFNAHL